LAVFAALDWHLGRVAVEVEHPPLPIDQLASLSPGALSLDHLIARRFGRPADQPNCASTASA
jgi:hypothetical protein